MAKRHAVSPSVTELDLASSMVSESDVYGELDGVSVVTAQQWQAIHMLAAGRRVSDVAETLGVARETVSRWRASPAFVAAFNLTLRETHTETVGELRSAAVDAVSVLRELLNAENERIRLSAAVAVLKLAVELDANVETLPTSPAAVASEERHRQSMLRLLALTA